MSLSERRAATVADYRVLARRALPKMVFDFVDGGGGMEDTVLGNRSALDAKRLMCSGPMNIETRHQGVELFGRKFAMPLIVGPTGLAGALWPKGELHLARAAGRMDIPFVVSTGSTCSLEEIAQSGRGAKWMQLYLLRQREFSDRLLENAEALEYEVIEVTVDNPVTGLRVRDVHNQFSTPFRWTPRKLASVLAHPGWAWRLAFGGGVQMSLLASIVGNLGGSTVAQVFREQLDPSVTWDDIARVRDRWRKPLIVKGLLDPAHVAKALAVGVDGVVISNHGGRQLDGAIATIDVLPDFVSEGGGRLKILIDSGFRTGSDVARALALGADAVQIGRPTLYALAAGGEDAVFRCLSCLKEELDVVQAMMGVADLRDFRPDMVRDLAPLPRASRARTAHIQAA